MIPGILEQLECYRLAAQREAAAVIDDRAAARRARRAQWERDRRHGKIKVKLRPDAARDRILALIREAGRPLSRQDIIKHFTYRDSVVEDRLNDLVVRNLITRVKRGWYSI